MFLVKEFKKMKKTALIKEKVSDQNKIKTPKFTCCADFLSFFKRLFRKRKVLLHKASKQELPDRTTIDPSKQLSKSNQIRESINSKIQKPIKPQLNTQSEYSFYDSKVSNRLSQQLPSLQSNNQNLKTQPQDHTQMNTTKKDLLTEDPSDLNNHTSIRDNYPGMFQNSESQAPLETDSTNNLRENLFESNANSTNLPKQSDGKSKFTFPNSEQTAKQQSSTSQNGNTPSLLNRKSPMIPNYFDDSNEENFVPEMEDSLSILARQMSNQDNSNSMNTTLNRSNRENGTNLPEIPKQPVQVSSTFKKAGKANKRTDMSIFDSFVNYKN